MTLLSLGAPWVGSAATGFLVDSANLDLVPAITGYQDLVRGIGKQVGPGNTISRALVNQLCPVGTAMVQTVPGADANTFTTRQAISGTFVNSMTIGDAAQVAGTFPAGAFNLLGRTIRVRGGGTWGATATPNFTLDVALGANILATTGVCAVSAVTMQNFYFDFISQVTTAGSSGVVNTAGMCTFNLTVITSLPCQMTNSTPGTGLSIDLTGSQVFTVNATCSASNALNRIRLWNCVAEILF